MPVPRPFRLSHQGWLLALFSLAMIAIFAFAMRGLVSVPLDFDEFNELASEMYFKRRSGPTVDHLLTRWASQGALFVVGPTAWVGRLSAIPSLLFLAVVLYFLLVKTISSRFVICLVLGNLCFNTVFQFYAFSARGYVFTAAAALLFLYGVANWYDDIHQKRFARVTAVSLVLLSVTNPFSIVFSLGVLAALGVELFRKRSRWSAEDRVCLVRTGLLWLAPLATVGMALIHDLMTVGEIGAITANPWQNLREFLSTTLGGGNNQPYFRTLIILVGVLLLGGRPSPLPDSQRFLRTAPWWGLAALIGAAWLSDSKMQARYFLVALIPVLIALGIAIRQMSDRLLRGAAAVVALVAFVFFARQTGVPEKFQIMYTPPGYEAFIRETSRVISQPGVCLSLSWGNRMGEFFRDYSRYFFFRNETRRQEMGLACGARFHAHFEPRDDGPFDTPTPEIQKPPLDKATLVYADRWGNSLYQLPSSF